jgi:hypothetical protein
MLGLLLLNSCRNDPPPAIEICILNGAGGGDCVEADGTKKFRLPSEMLNYWSTNQPDMKNFSSWCYQTTPANTGAQMDKIFEEATGEASSRSEQKYQTANLR